MARDSQPALNVVPDLPDVVLPGTNIAEIVLVAGGDKRRVPKLSAGVAQRDRTIVATKAGVVRNELRTGRIAVEANGRRYVAGLENMVVGVVVERHSDEYRIYLHGTDTAVLPALAFEGATKRNKPNLTVGAAVYARVVRASAATEVELSCVEPGSAKSWVSKSATFGELTGGTLVRVSLALARALRVAENHVLATVGERIPFECAIGMNGLVWVNGDGTRQTVVVAQAIEAADTMPRKEWDTWVKKLLRSAS